MLGCVVVTCPVALKAQAVAFLDGLDAVDVMAVAAAHIPCVHLALGERGVGIDLIQNLTVGKVQFPGKQAGQHGIQKILFGVGVIPQDRPTGMTRRAQFHQFAGFQFGGANCKVVVFHFRPSHVRKFRPLHMP